MVELGIHSPVAQSRIREVELSQDGGLCEVLWCQVPSKHQVLFIGHPKFNLAMVLDDWTLIPEGVTSDLGWLAIFHFLMGMMDESLYIAFVFHLISIRMCGCVDYTYGWIMMMMRTFDLGFLYRWPCIWMEMDYTCLRLGKLFSGLMDWDTFEMEPWHDTNNGEYTVTFRWFVCDWMDDDTLMDWWWWDGHFDDGSNIMAGMMMMVWWMEPFCWIHRPC